MSTLQKKNQSMGYNRDGGIMYTPKIKEELIHELYLLKKKTGKAITKLANEAIREYLKRIKEENNE